ncbi:MAG: response regulator [Mariprofundaceae bacterium]|nr:response regulator [Mariprofundaceae bacterium]
MILLIDKNILLLETMHDYLRALGHRCMTTQDTLEGLDIISREPETRLVISEFKMPYCNGAELIKQARDIRPALKSILIASRHDIDTIPAGTLFLAKPFSFDALGLMVSLYDGLKKESPNSASSNQRLASHWS